jgi:iron complex outermembrane recepter protein
VLVLMDGRAVYNPLFHGTYWELQNYPLDDIDRIEVIRGPGGTLWGANAVNGVINVITKSAKDTQGGRATAGAGSEEKAFGSVRYGGKSGKDLNYRVYGEYFDRDATFHPNGNNFDPWHMGQSGFRTDWDASERDLVTVQGDLYRGRAGQSAATDEFSNFFGSNILSRWSRSLDDKSGFTLQLYYDRADRRDPNFIEDHNTGDIDFQYRLPLPGRQDVTWGAEYRVTADQTDSAPGIRLFDPARQTIPTYSTFLQDVIALKPEKLSLTLGTKLENNFYSGWELQPSIRLQGMPTDRQSAWASVSRAVRTPSRLERDLFLNGLARGTGFDSEKVIAYELGYRVDPLAWLSLDAAAFYNDYTDLLSAEPGTPIRLSNGLQGYTQGGELGSNVQLLPGWRLRGTYSLLDMNLRTKAGSLDTTTEASAEGSSPRHQATLHSLMDLPHHVELDPVLRYVSALRALQIPAYVELDVQAAWHPVQRIGLSLVGQNLLHSHHPEFTQTSELERGVYGKATWSW